MWLEETFRFTLGHSVSQNTVIDDFSTFNSFRIKFHMQFYVNTGNKLQSHPYRFTVIPSVNGVQGTPVHKEFTSNKVFSCTDHIHKKKVHSGGRSSLSH